MDALFPIVATGLYVFVRFLVSLVLANRWAAFAVTFFCLVCLCALAFAVLGPVGGGRAAGAMLLCAIVDAIWIAFGKPATEPAAKTELGPSSQTPDQSPATNFGAPRVASSRSHFETFTTWALRALLAALAGLAPGALVGLAIAWNQDRAHEKYQSKLMEDAAIAVAAAEQAEAAVRPLAAERLRLVAEANAHADPPLDGIRMLGMRSRPFLWQAEEVGKREAQARGKAEFARADANRAQERVSASAGYSDDWWAVLVGCAILGALALGALPAAVAGWFLLLHMIAQLSRAARGQDGSN